jgi:hypothetical protein
MPGQPRPSAWLRDPDPGRKFACSGAARTRCPRFFAAAREDLSIMSAAPAVHRPVRSGWGDPLRPALPGNGITHLLTKPWSPTTTGHKAGPRRTGLVMVVVGSGLVSLAACRTTDSARISVRRSLLRTRWTSPVPATGIRLPRFGRWPVLAVRAGGRWPDGGSCPRAVRNVP